MSQAGIFISYRRQDSRGATGRLVDGLTANFGESEIFRDIETIAPGTNFETALERALDACAVLIAVIGPQWTSVTDEQGRRRLDHPHDWVRQEIARAFRRGVRVIPVLVDGATMPREQDLPEDLKLLPKLQALELSERHWKSDLGLLADTIIGVHGISRRFRLERLLRKASKPTLVAALVVGFAVAGLAITWGLDGEQPNYDQLVTVAVQRLSATQVDQRLEAIGELERVARSSERHRGLVLEKLAELVRERAPWAPDRIAERTESDVQMALTVIGKLPKSGKIDLHNVDISGANLENADLREAVLWGSNLRGATLARADLTKADLGGCDFTDASLEMANLEGAYIWPSDVAPPVRPSVFLRTRLSAANLKDTVLYGADLSGAVGLQAQQLAQAKMNGRTRLPARLHRIDRNAPQDHRPREQNGKPSEK